MHSSSVLSCRSLALVALLTLIPSSGAQTTHHGTSSGPAHSILNMPEPMFGSMPLVAPVFLQTDQVDSNITVVNAITSAVNGTVTLRDQVGNVVGQQTVLFSPHSSTILALKSLLASAGSQAHSGSVTLEQDPAIKGPALLAQLSMTLHSGSQGVFLEEEFGMPTAHGSAVLQGVASQTRNLPLVAITSVSDAAQTISANCVGEDKATTSMTLPAHGTAVVQACSWHAVPDGALNLTSSLLNSSGAADADHAILLKSDSVPGSFYAFGFALNGGLDQAQLQPLDFYDPGVMPTSSITYVGVPVGSNPALASVLSPPVLTLANFSGQPRQTTVTWADSSSGTPKVQPVANITLAPFSTQTTTLSAVTGSGLLNTFTISSNGQPGDVQAHLFTQVGSSKRRTELLAKDAHDDHNAGAHPWSTAGGDTSTLLLFNSSTTPQQFNVRISVSGSEWMELYTLAPNETKAIAINDLARKSTPDHKHRTLSTSLTRGEVQWNTPMGGTGLGRLLVTNAGMSLARNFSCTTYQNMCSASFGPENEEDLVLNGGAIDLSLIQATFCTEYSPYSCSQNTTVGTAYSFTTQWSTSGNVSIASSANSDIRLQGTSAGQFSVTALAQAGSCSSPPLGGGGTVQVPSSLTVVHDTQSTLNCGQNAPHVDQRILTYSITDQNGSPMSSPPSIVENMPASTTSSCNGNPIGVTSSCTLTINTAPGNVSQFNDTLTSGCIAANAQTPCGFTYPNQQWQYCQSSGGHAVMGTIGPLNITNSIDSVDGNTIDLTGTTFKP